MYKAVFLDRDGVINDNSKDYYIYLPDAFIINPDVIESILLLKNKGYKLFIVSNQGGISKGLYSKRDVEIVHEKMLGIFDSYGIVINEIYFCPHHDSVENCICRKPDSGLIEKLIARYDIDKDKSYFIGDSDRDSLAANKAGLHAIKIESNTSILEVCKAIVKN